MKLIDNTKVYGIDESVKASKYPMAVDISKLTTELTPTAISLAQSGMGEGHDNWLNGVIVQFDLTFTIKAWVEAERYHFFDFVSSQSTMHKAAQMDIRIQCNEYVTDNTIAEVERLKEQYLANRTIENFLFLIYNIPTGFRLTARMTTDYRQLKTMYNQRKFHKLPEWREFCRWIESLPHSELITGA